MVPMESTWSRSIIGWIIDLVDRPSQAHYWLKCIRFANQLRFLIARQSYPPDHPAPHCRIAALGTVFAVRFRVTLQSSPNDPICFSDSLLTQSPDSLLRQSTLAVCSDCILWWSILMVYSGSPFSECHSDSPFWQLGLFWQSTLLVYPFSLLFQFTLLVYPSTLLV